MVHEGGRRVWRVRAIVHPSLWIVEQWWLCASQAFLVEPSPNCVEAYRDAATIWWARLALGSDNARVDDRRYSNWNRCFNNSEKGTGPNF